MKKRFFSSLFIIASVLSLSLLLPLWGRFSALISTSTQATPPPSSPAAGKVTLTFDDGESGIFEYAAPILASGNIQGAAYITTDFIDASGFMTWDQIKELHDTYGWEIGSHTVTHPSLPELDNEQLDEELKNSKSILENQGLEIQAFATPFGHYDNNVLAYIAKYYSSHRVFEEEAENIFPYNNYLLREKSVLADISASQVKEWIDEAMNQGNWLILVFHNILASGAEDYDWNASNLQEIVNYIVSAEVPTATVTKALSIAGENLVQNPSFEELEGNWVTHWTTDNPSEVVVDANSNGSFLYPTHSIKMTGGSTARHLFSEFIPVKSQDKYLWRTYVNLQDYLGGELGFYIDEYDTQGNWISGQWLNCIQNNFVGMKTYQYTPTNSDVVKIGLQIYVWINSNFTAYLDSFEFRSLLVTCEPITEVCDGLDNDCDGEIDEGGVCEEPVCDDCDDGLYCNGVETCLSGVCQAGTPIDCSDLSNQCNEGVCDETHRQCLAQPKLDGTACDDSLFCTVNDVCMSGLCAGVTRDCSDGVACTIDSCDEVYNVCVKTPDNSYCNDSLWCDGTETCNATLGCQPGTPVDCSDGNKCTIDNCDENINACAYTNVADNTPCTNGVCCSGACKIGVTKCTTAVKCWSGSNGYLYKNNNQAKKFCKCAQGIYGYKSYSYTWSRKTVYEYLNPGDNENWEVTSSSSYLPVYKVRCTDRNWYATNQDYYWPK